MKQYFSFFFQAVLSRVPRCTFCLRRTHANLQAGCGWSPPPLPLLPLSHSSFLSPPPEPHPGLPGLPSPQPPGRHPERREAQTWPEAIYRVGVGRGGKPTALCNNHLNINVGFPGGTVVRNLPAMWETQVRFLGWEDPLEKEMATHFSSLTWRFPWTEESGRLQSMGSKRVTNPYPNPNINICVCVYNSDTQYTHTQCCISRN